MVEHLQLQACNIKSRLAFPVRLVRKYSITLDIMIGRKHVNTPNMNTNKHLAEVHR